MYVLFFFKYLTLAISCYKWSPVALDHKMFFTWKKCKTSKGWLIYIVCILLKSDARENVEYCKSLSSYQKEGDTFSREITGHSRLAVGMSWLITHIFCPPISLTHYTQQIIFIQIHFKLNIILKKFSHLRCPLEIFRQFILQIHIK